MSVTGTPDGHDLDRFLTAQDSGGTYAQALAELRSGRKTSHWMWFVFPQVAGLGRSSTARFFAVSGLAEAEEYLAHPVLGPRLLESAAALTGLAESDPVRVFGPVDAMKLHSSMTLFARAAPDEPVFASVLEQYFDGVADQNTLDRL